jgi:adenylate cyclase
MLIDPDNMNMRYNFACVLASQLDDKEDALHLLERTLNTANEMILRHTETDPDFDSIRDDPRFAAMVERARKRLGITEEPAAPVAQAPVQSSG